MITTCPVCRETVVSHIGYLVRHGSSVHRRFELCSGSGSPVCTFNSMSCCG